MRSFKLLFYSYSLKRTKYPENHPKTLKTHCLNFIFLCIILIFLLFEIIKISYIFQFYIYHHRTLVISFFIIFHIQCYNFSHVSDVSYQLNIMNSSIYHHFSFWWMKLSSHTLVESRNEIEKSSIMVCVVEEL